jgi:peptidyl-dipeptidase A
VLRRLAVIAIIGGLTKIMSESRDWNDLLWAWTGWRNATGSIKRYYQEFVQLKNKAATMNGTWCVLYD